MKTRTWLLIVIVLIVTGCARSCGRMAYHRQIATDVEQHEYAVEPAELWDETRGLLRENGIRFDERALPDDETRLSNWVGPRGQRYRYSARIVSMPTGTSKLYLHRIEETKVPVYEEGAFNDPDGPPPKPIGHRFETSRTRDHMLEWDVLRVVAPARASEIEEAAREREEVVRDVVANGCT